MKMQLLDWHKLSLQEKCIYLSVLDKQKVLKIDKN